jgi:hypothetical protein
LVKLRFATREQLQQLHRLGSDRNALRILGELKDYMTIKTLDGRNVYYLSALGREVVGYEDEIKWSQNVGHSIMRNDLYLYLGMPKDWRIEEPVSFQYVNGLTLKEMRIIPDATYTEGGVHHFVEVDHTQSMIENKRKIESYSYLVPSIKQQYNHTPMLIFYTLTELRREKLNTLCKEAGVSCRVYTKEDLR